MEAGPPSAVYRAGKFVRRHRLAVTAGLTVVMALAVGFVLASLGLARAQRAERRANEEARAARGHFAVLACRIAFMDWLLLSIHGHRRAQFRWMEGRWEAAWVSP